MILIFGYMTLGASCLALGLVVASVFRKPHHCPDPIIVVQANGYTYCHMRASVLVRKTQMTGGKQKTGYPVAVIDLGFPSLSANGADAVNRLARNS